MCEAHIAEQSGLIATNTDELRALRTLGDRAYFEFNLTKSKEPKRIGDIAVLLRKTDPTKKLYTLEVYLGNQKVQKKDKTTNEPIQFYSTRSRQPYEIVVNAITKDRVIGYLAAPGSITTPATARYARSDQTMAALRYGEASIWNDALITTVCSSEIKRFAWSAQQILQIETRKWRWRSTNGRSYAAILSHINLKILSIQLSRLRTVGIGSEDSREGGKQPQRCIALFGPSQASVRMIASISRNVLFREVIASARSRSGKR